MSDRLRAQGHATGKHRILVVDDEATIRDSLVDILEEAGYEAVGAKDGRDALRKLRTALGTWSLILLDLTMPVMDGRAFRQAQRRDRALAPIPIVVVSAFRDVAERARDLDAAAYLTKPLSVPVLLELLRALCPPRAR